MTQTANFLRPRPARNALMLSCGWATIALAPQAADAQAFQGNITSTTGGPIVRTTPTATTETVTVGSDRATINWSPTNQQQGGGAIDFLPSGNSATFTSAQGITDFTVLNRIIPGTGQPISLNGHVISTLQGTSATGGRVWFYSPNGIVIGATAVFDVGSLLVTINDVTSFGTNANGFDASFSGTAGSTASIQVQKGARINALQPGSYVALIAPRIEQGGTVRVNGSAAYVAAEQATMTVNQGLFDIQVDVGTGDANGVVHTGETSGPANAAAADNHSIYMVAVPKNQALTMLLGGKAGFDDAVSASVENGQIVLSAGYNVAGTTFDKTNLGGAAAGMPAGMTIAGGDFTSSVIGAATGSIDASGGGSTLSFAQDVSLQGLAGATLAARDGETVTVGGDATISANDLRDFVTTDSGTVLDALAGTATISADVGGSISIAGTATVSADARSGNNSALLTGGSAHGGHAAIDAQGGTISIGGAASVSARALVASVPVAGVGGYDGTGGYALVSAANGGSIHVNGALNLDASGAGTSAISAPGSTGGFGYGGAAAIMSLAGGTIAAGNTTLTANAAGGSGPSAGGALAGNVELLADRSGLERATTISLGNVNIAANGTPGLGTRGAEVSGSGGSVKVLGLGSTIQTGALNIQANGPDFGGAIEIQSDLDLSGHAASLHFGSTHAAADSDNHGGSISVASGPGSSIDLGDAALRTSGTSGGNVDLHAGTCFDCGSGEVMAPSVTPPSDGGIAATDLSLASSGNISIRLSNGADVAVSGTLSANAGQIVSLLDDGTGGAIRAHIIDLSATTIVDSADLVADIIRLTSASGMDLADLSASDSLTLKAGGDLTAGDLSAANALTLTSGGSVKTGDLSSRTVKVTATKDSSVADVNAPESASFKAGGLAAFTGTVNSPTISVTSGDIDIAKGASLGVQGVTEVVTLNAATGGAVVIGDGPASEGQYRFDEDGVIRTAGLTFNAPGDVHIFDFQVNGSGTGGGIAKLVLNSEGSVFVDGQLDFINAGAGDLLSIKSGNRVQVNSDTGRIQMTGSNGKLAGTLDLTAGELWVASEALLTQLDADPNFAGRNDALGVNSRTPNQDGVVRADTIHAAVGDSLLVQNTGTPELFAGIDTGDGGLSIENVTKTPVPVIVYGRQTLSDGTVITNQAFLDRVVLLGTGGFTPDSSVNGCIIGGGAAACGSPPEELFFTIDYSTILGPLDKDDKDDSDGDDSQRLIDTSPLNLDDQVDEPVTSGGDIVGSPN